MFNESIRLECVHREDEYVAVLSTKGKLVCSKSNKYFIAKCINIIKTFRRMSTNLSLLVNHTNVTDSELFTCIKELLAFLRMYSTRLGLILVIYQFISRLA